jgi:hypothetical protein
MDALPAPSEPSAELVAQVEARELAERKHAYTCKVCQHSEREDIDAAYLGWHSFQWLFDTFGVHPRYMRRHAAFFRLDKRRVEGCHRALGHIMALGLENLKPEDVSLQDVFRAIEGVNRLMARQHRDLGGVIPSAGDGGSVEATWEERIVRGRMRQEGAP